MKIIKFPQKRKVSKLNYRANIQIQGIPFEWETHLNDDEIKQLYQILLRERILIKPTSDVVRQEKSKTLTLEISDLLDIFETEFKGLKYRIGIIKNKIRVTCRPADEWDIIEKEEKKEVKKLKEAEGKYKVYNSCLSLMENGDLLVNKGDYEKAKTIFINAIEMKMSNKGNQLLNFVRPIWPLLNLFYKTKSVEEGIEFLKQYKSKFRENESISYWIAFGRNFERDGDINNAEKIYKLALERDSEYWETYKRLCIIYERAKRYNDAVTICKLAIDRNLSDDTKSGFEGRLKRILKKMIS
jgi:tetratricopeptide (TPR) repeat protein